MSFSLLIIVLLVGIYLLWNVGANDVANAMGTSIGSGAISLKQAIFIAAIFEFSGAFLLGSKVSTTLQSIVISPYSMLFIYGMISAMLATGIWIQIATYNKWPISTTNAIVGGITGFGIASGNNVNWILIFTIATSWLLIPLISGTIAFGLFKFIQKKILFVQNPLFATKKLFPYLVFFTLVIFLVPSLNNLFYNKYHLTIFCIVVSVTVTVMYTLRYRNIYDNMSIMTMENQQIHILKKAKKQLIKASLVSKNQEINKQIKSITKDISRTMEQLQEEKREEKVLSNEYTKIEVLFASLQIITACLVAFAHGSNDVANAIGPISAILTNGKIDQWLLAFGGGGIILGLVTYGWKVIYTIGKDLTPLTPSRGFCAELAAGITILVSSNIGLPISTTHAVVGGVFGVGVARGLSSLNLNLVKQIFFSWIITVPISACLTILIFSLCQIFI